MQPDGYIAMTIGRGIRCAAVRAPDKAALVLDDNSLSYRTLTDRIARVGNLASAKFQLQAGDRVALLAPNCLPYVEIVAGMSDIGAIVATLNPRLTRAELRDILDDCTPRLLIAHPDCRASVDPEWAKDVAIVWLDDGYEQLLAAASPEPVASTVGEEAPFALAYTSGTTGRPKGVLLSHRSRSVTFMAMAAEYRCFGPEDNFLALAPMCHGAGFAFAVAALFFGGTTTLFSSQEAEPILARIGQGDITGIFMVPTHLARIFDLPEQVLARHRGHGLHTIISNAAALPQHLKEAAISYFGEGLLNETYGSTEGGIVTNIRPRDLQRKPGSVGHPFPYVEVVLRRRDGSLADIDEPGELFCRGPATFNGYWNRPDDTRGTLVDGWVTVGDIATCDADGFISIIDRKKDMIITGGLNVYPCEIENVISNMPGVREVAVVGAPHREWGESLHAFIVPNAGQDVDREVILSACRAQLAGFKVPRAISFLTELPRNAGGKILKTSLREQLLA
jgi:acyl-CoA synthetase (AMP-forming)/AMP-acid ligase II